jgi:hypothetical protein
MQADFPLTTKQAFTRLVLKYKMWRFYFYLLHTFFYGVRYLTNFV